MVLKKKKKKKKKGGVRCCGEWMECRCVSYLCRVGRRQRRSCSTVTQFTERIQLHRPPQPYQPLSLCLYLSLSLSKFLSSSSSLLSLSLSLYLLTFLSRFLLLPLAFLLPLLLFSPPTSPCMERRLTASPPLSLSPSVFLSPASRWLHKLGNLFADKVINTTLASPNIHHSALCVFLLALSDARGVGLLNNGRRGEKGRDEELGLRHRHATWTTTSGQKLLLSAGHLLIGHVGN